MDNMIREYLANNSESFTLPVGVDEEKKIYQFDEIALIRFVNQVVYRTKELSAIRYS
jgi:uncharacterized protein YkuJ